MQCFYTSTSTGKVADKPLQNQGLLPNEVSLDYVGKLKVPNTPDSPRKSIFSAPYHQVEGLASNWILWVMEKGCALLWHSTCFSISTESQISFRWVGLTSIGHGGSCPACCGMLSILGVPQPQWTIWALRLCESWFCWLEPLAKKSRSAIGVP